MVIGPEKVQEIFEACKGPTVKTTEPLTAAVRALKAMKAMKFGLITPYIGDINNRMREYFSQNGLEVSSQVFSIRLAVGVSV